ncbi:MAG TPA: ABC transporter permease [Candidatus Limnocylindrales bacterium]|nr:ABC transporter permease [Candidatus Limnocylindrales bacterium]
MSRPASSLGAVGALARHELGLTARRGENVLVTLVIPASVLVFFGTVGVVPGIDGRAVDFLLPGSLALAIIASGLVSLGIVTAFERSYGVLKRLGGAPLPGWGLVASKLAAVLVLEVLQVAVLIAVAATVLDWRPGPGTSIPLFAAAVVLGSVAFVGLGLLLAGSLRAEAMLAVANLLFLACFVVGGIVLPVDHSPAPFDALVRALPASALADLFRAALGTGAEVAGPVIVLVAWGAGAAGLAVRTFRWD